MSYKLFFNKATKKLDFSSNVVSNECSVLFETYEDNKAKSCSFSIPDSNFKIEIRTMFQSYKLSKQIFEVSIEFDGYSFVDYSKLIGSSFSGDHQCLCKEFYPDPDSWFDALSYICNIYNMGVINRVLQMDDNAKGMIDKIKVMLNKNEYVYRLTTYDEKNKSLSFEEKLLDPSNMERMVLKKMTDAIKLLKIGGLGKRDYVEDFICAYYPQLFFKAGSYYINIPKEDGNEKAKIKEYIDFIYSTLREFDHLELLFEKK